MIINYKKTRFFFLLIANHPKLFGKANVTRVGCVDILLFKNIKKYNCDYVTTF